MRRWRRLCSRRFWGLRRLTLFLSPACERRDETKREKRWQSKNNRHTNKFSRSVIAGNCEQTFLLLSSVNCHNAFITSSIELLDHFKWLFFAVLSQSFNK
jgi:hypothetical protein